MSEEEEKMSDCMRCDRCRRVYERGSKYVLSMEFPGFADRDIDLCDKCTKEFREFMAAKRRVKRLNKK